MPAEQSQVDARGILAAQRERDATYQRSPVVVALLIAEWA
jgi:hypothetical protein